MKHLLLILNPTAGTKKADKYLSNIISVFNQAEYDTHVYITTSRGDATRAVKLYGNQKDVIVCCGGDSTVYVAYWICENAVSTFINAMR